MLPKYSNVSEVPLSLAVFLATDHYDYNSDPSTISATTLIKPLRQIILSGRVPATESVSDLTQMMASRMGTAIHDGIERAWKGNYQNAMRALGYPEKIIERVRINPEKTSLTKNCIPVYMEQRASKKVGRYTVTGKYDFIGDGRIEDFKSTSTYTAMKHTNDDKYILQGSIYRWLEPELITQDEMAIQFIFTDWSGAKARQDSNYPQRRYQTQIFPLKSLHETEAFVTRKIAQIEQHMDTPEADLPLCSDEDLWRTEPVWKYYKNPAKTSRSTKNFDTKEEAYIRMSEDGNVGIVKEQPGTVSACKYCPAFSECRQKDALIASGDLVL